MRKKQRRSRAQLADLQHNLSEILGADAMQELIGLARLRRFWSDIVGSMMAGRTEPIQIEHLPDGGVCLWVAVDHSIMSQQIRFLRDDIRKACFKFAGIDNMHKIRTRMQPGAGIPPKAPPPKPKAVSLQQKRGLAKELATIKDRNLRKAAFRARLAQIAYGNEENK